MRGCLALLAILGAVVFESCSGSQAEAPVAVARMRIPRIEVDAPVVKPELLQRYAYPRRVATGWRGCRQRVGRAPASPGVRAFRGE